MRVVVQCETIPWWGHLSIWVWLFKFKVITTEHTHIQYSICKLVLDLHNKWLWNMFICQLCITNRYKTRRSIEQKISAFWQHYLAAMWSGVSRSCFDWTSICAPWSSKVFTTPWWLNRAASCSTLNPLLSRSSSLPLFPKEASSRSKCPKDPSLTAARRALGWNRTWYWSSSHSSKLTSWLLLHAGLPEFWFWAEGMLYFCDFLFAMGGSCAGGVAPATSNEIAQCRRWSVIAPSDVRICFAIQIRRSLWAVCYIWPFVLKVIRVSHSVAFTRANNPQSPAQSIACSICIVFERLSREHR